MKRILIAIPCKNDIEADTFKSIYELEVPEDVVTTFQYFYGYSVSQVRNLIADWVVRGFDYLLAIDHDIVFPPDTLKKLLAHDVDVAGGLYIQRLDPPMPEAYDFNMHRLDINQCINNTVFPVGGIGMGCTLIKREAFERVQYPYFVYKEALDHRNTFSEDLDFCKKATTTGSTILLDTSIRCKHIGQRIFEVPGDAAAVNKLEESIIETRFNELAAAPLLPQQHVNYMNKLRTEGLRPKIIYDIGACVLHWTSKAREIWPESDFFVFEAMREVENFYRKQYVNYFAGVILGSEENKQVEYYKNLYHPGGNSIFKENSQFSPNAEVLFTENNKEIRHTTRLDTLIRDSNLPLPDLIKIDVQGSELEILKGATTALDHCQDIIIEAQIEEYNCGAPQYPEVFKYLNDSGFELIYTVHQTEFDADYHFRKIKV